MICHTEILTQSFGKRIIASNRKRIDIAAHFFYHPSSVREASIHFHGRKVDHAANLFLCGKCKEMLGALHGGPDGFDRVFHHFL